MTILKLFANEDKVLLVGWNPLLVLNHGRHIIDGVRGLDLQADRLLPGEDELTTCMVFGALIAS